MNQVGKRPVMNEGDAFEVLDVEYECFETAQTKFRGFIEGAIQDATNEAQNIALEQARQEVSDQGCFHKREWTDSGKQEFYRSLDVCLSTFKGAFVEELSQQLDAHRDEDLVEELEMEAGLPDPPLDLQLAAHLDVMNLTQVQAAAALGVSKMTLSHWLKAPGEKGKRGIPKKHEARVRAWIGAE